jgi:hypothetical protein
MGTLNIVNDGEVRCLSGKRANWYGSRWGFDPGSCWVLKL